MTSAANVYGIFNNGIPVTHGGLDSDGYAYSANLLGDSIEALGVPFTLGDTASADAAANATILLPSGNFAHLSLLGAAVNGDQPDQTFVVTYTDGSIGTFKQSLSDWCTPRKFNGETTVSLMPYRITPSGSQSSGGSIYLYGYQFSLNSGKTAKSITLPPNRNVAVLAITLSQ
jgi:hypothetical protein